MSKLVPRQIYLDIEEWEQLGEKVGKNNRSQWLREQIHEMVKLPDERQALEESLEQHEIMTGKIKEKLFDLRQREQIELEELGNKSDRLDKALEEANELLQKQTTLSRETKQHVPMIGLDQIKEIAENFKVDNEELLDIIRADDTVEILKYGNAGTKETKSSVFTPGR